MQRHDTLHHTKGEGKYISKVPSGKSNRYDEVDNQQRDHVEEGRNQGIHMNFTHKIVVKRSRKRTKAAKTRAQQHQVLRGKTSQKHYKCDNETVLLEVIL